MQAISKAHAWLINALKTLSCLIVFLIFVLIVMDVLLPLVGLQPWEGTLGVVEYGLLWFTILAAPWLARIKGHVFIDAVAELLSPGARKVTSKLAYSSGDHRFADACMVFAGTRHRVICRRSNR